MRVEIIELLRCPAAHESSPLVTVAHARDGDRLIDGVLGCAMCGAEYSMRSGVVYLAERALELPRAMPNATRTGALLGLSEPAARAALCGAFGAIADEIEQGTGVTCIAVNASPDVRHETGADHVVIGGSAQLPLANASLNGLAVDDMHVALLADAARAVRTGGRVLAPAHAPLPGGLRELARDENEWVAVVETSVSAPVGLRRGGAFS